MIEKPKTVLELFEGHPERWTQGAFSRDNKGFAIWEQAFFKEASSFCLTGAISFIYDKHIANGPEYTKLRNHLNVGAVYIWNDTKGRNFNEVVEACRAAGI